MNCPYCNHPLTVKGKPIKGDYVTCVCQNILIYTDDVGSVRKLTPEELDYYHDVVKENP